jgi:hypothetical protein
VKPHPRIRRAIKWGGAAVTVLLVVVWIGSGWWHVNCWASRRAIEVSVSGGVFDVMWGPAIDFPAGDGDRRSLEAGWRVGTVYTNIGWYYDRGYHLSWWYWGDLSRYLPHLRSVGVPLWVIVALALAVTARGWRLDTLARRRARVGLCPECGYDRRGLSPDAPCPECGMQLSGEGHPRAGAD